MKDYYFIIEDIHKIAKKENATLGEITQIMEEVGEWAKAASQRIMTTRFSRPKDEESAISALGNALLDLFDAFDTDKLKAENGTEFKFGTVFNSEQQPVFTIHGIEFYSEDGKKYDRFSEIPVNVVVCYWYNGVPRGWFIKLTNSSEPKKQPFIELEKVEVDY